MEGQHPIPQQVTSYEFKLVGDMTLKQFVKAAGGIIIALLLNKSNLLVIFKWPLMLVSAGLGLALAFVPFEDRPLDVWVSAFLKSIYAPTIYTYKKKNEDWLDLTKASTQDSEKPIVEVRNENLFMKTSGVDSLTVNGSGENILKSNSKDSDMTEKEEQRDNPKVNAFIDQESTEKESIVESRNDEVKVDDWRDKSSDLDLKKEKLEATGTAVFGSIPMPDRPDTPNVIVGMATDSLGKIIESVIVEIQDTHGNPTRVIKTNALGQFKISTPLANGRYLMIAEKDGYIFDRVNIDLVGKIVDPVKIIAHN